MNRLKAWAHWVKQEKEPDEDRLLMAQDIAYLIDRLGKLERVREAAKVVEPLFEERVANTITHLWGYDKYRAAVFFLHDTLKEAEESP